MTKTYSEQRAAILLKAARDLYAVAGSVLDDVLNPVELRSMPTLEWAKRQAAKYAKQAREIEDLGYEVGVYLPAGTSAAQTRAHRRYSDSVTAFQKRIEAEAGIEFVAAVNAIETGV